MIKIMHLLHTDEMRPPLFVSKIGFSILLGGKLQLLVSYDLNIPSQEHSGCNGEIDFTDNKGEAFYKGLLTIT